jgi:hypothetical protein
VNIKPTAKQQAAEDAATAAADSLLVAFRAWCRLEGEEAQPRLEVLHAYAEQGRALCSMLLADFERPRAATAVDVDSYAAFEALQLEHLRLLRLLEGTRALLDS